MWPSGKAPGFGPGIRGFESLHPSQEKMSPFGLIFSWLALRVRIPGFVKQNIAGFGEASETRKSMSVFFLVNERRSEDFSEEIGAIPLYIC